MNRQLNPARVNWLMISLFGRLARHSVFDRRPHDAHNCSQSSTDVGYGHCSVCVQFVVVRMNTKGEKVV